jgi:hypothetical protein
MPEGPGKYDALCTTVREATDAEAAIVIIVGGFEGPGFSVQTKGRWIARRLPTLLRTVANQIEADSA